MATYTKNTPARVSVTFCGQSQNDIPSGSDSYPDQMLATRPTYRRYNAYRDGVGWGVLSSRPQYLNMLDQSAKAALTTVAIMLGGFTNYVTGSTGAQCYTFEGSYATSWRSKGGVKVLGTTTPPSLDFGVNTTVAVGSNGVNTSTFAGSGTLNVAATTNAPNTGTLKVATAGTTATITYTGKSGTTFTGCTTTSGGGVMSTGGTVRQDMYQNWLDGNGLVLADASHVFDSVVDLAANANLSDPSNTTYYVDGIHWTTAGATVAAGLIGPALDALVA